jgi:hypothetical protein
MPANSAVEQIRFDQGPLPGMIFNYEPAIAEGKDCPTPTRVKVTTSSREDAATFRQTLDDQGRVTATYVNESKRPHLKRHWGEDDTYVDRSPKGTLLRQVAAGAMQGTFDVRSQALGLEATIARQQTPEGDTYWLVRDRQEHDANEAIRRGDGRLTTEGYWQIWSDYDEYGFGPNYIKEWHYDESGALQEVVKPRGGANGHPYVERYARIGGNTLTVAGLYTPEPNPLVGVSQTREYDDIGRVVLIQHTQSVPTSATMQATVELSYEP